MQIIEISFKKFYLINIIEKKNRKDTFTHRSNSYTKVIFTAVINLKEGKSKIENFIT